MKLVPVFFFKSLLDLIERPYQAGGRISRAVVARWEGGPGILVFVLNEGGPLPALGPRRAQPPASGGGRPLTWAACGDEASTVARSQTHLVDRCRQHLFRSEGTVGSFAAGLLLGLCGLHVTGADSEPILGRVLGPAPSRPGPGLPQRERPGRVLPSVQILTCTEGQCLGREGGPSSPGRKTSGNHHA